MSTASERSGRNDETCRPVTLPTGQTIRVRGAGELSPEAVEALGALVEVATRRYAAEHPDGPAPMPVARCRIAGPHPRHLWTLDHRPHRCPGVEPGVDAGLRPDLRDRVAGALAGILPPGSEAFAQRLADAALVELQAGDTSRDAPHPGSGRDMMREPMVRPTRFEVSLLPEGCPDADLWTVTVEHRGAGRWAVRCRTRTVGADGSWSLGFAWRGGDREPASDAEWDDYHRAEDEWLAAHRFDLDAAIRLAKEAAPKIVVNGISAIEALRRSQETA